ncbi:MAG: PRC-barrel domain-containing protein [Clostridia bacterium]|nr:PRC-barrel domain-containing protein [Clostridia bacterium]
MYESFLKWKGKKIYGKDTNKYYGRLSDILVNKDTSMIIGIISKNDSLIYKHRLFLIKDVIKWDEVCIYVKGYGEKFVKVVPLFENFKSCENDIYGKSAVYSDGTRAGRVRNIGFNFEAGELAAFEVGSSLVQDLLSGRLICPAQNTVNYLQDCIVLEKADKF